MRLPSPGHPHLTYCTNIHPGESWREVRANLERYVLAVKTRVAGDAPFGVGLRLSAQAADALAQPGELAALDTFLAAHGLYVFTINGFPYGAFHGTRVKEAVYLPDWLDEARLVYTDRLATLLARLLPPEPELEGTVSTVPGAFKSRVPGEREAARLADLLLRHVVTLNRIREETGKVISLALEPEPWCYLETVADTVAFFERHLFASSAVARLGDLTGLGRAQSEASLRRHLGVCFDACHMAVEFEDPRQGLQALRAAGIRVSKVQLSAGLKVWLDGRDPETRRALRPFANDVYLHQVVQRVGGRLTRFLDLPQALDAVTPDADSPREWRIHFHVPLFLDRLGPFHNTQDYLQELLDLVAGDAACQHLEVETYTWDVLPEEHRREDIVASVARELRWVMDRIPG